MKKRKCCLLRVTEFVLFSKYFRKNVIKVIFVFPYLWETLGFDINDKINILNVLYMATDKFSANVLMDFKSPAHFPSVTDRVTKYATI